MLTRIKQFINFIVNSGLVADDIDKKNREVKLSNYASLIVIGVIVVLFTVRRTLYANVQGGLNIYQLLVGIIVLSIPIILNRFSFTSISRVYLCYITVLYVWIVNSMLLKNKVAVTDTSIFDVYRIFLLSFSLIPYLLFSKKELTWQLLSILPSFISIIFLEAILSALHISYKDFGIKSQEYPIMQIRTFIGYIVLNSICIVFRNIIHASDKQRAKYIKKLESRSDLAEKQNIILTKNRQELALLNKNLEHLVEQKTLEIENRNKKIVHFTFENSNQIKSSVDRLLSIMNTSKKHEEINFNQYIENLNEEVIALDLKVKKLSEELQIMDNSGRGD